MALQTPRADATTASSEAHMSPRRIVMVAMPCQEVVEIGGVLDALYAANQCLAAAGASDPGYSAEVMSPVVTVRAWSGLRLVAERSFRNVRGPMDTLMVTGVDGPDDARRYPDLVRWLARQAPRCRRVVGLCTGSYLLAEAGLLDGRRPRRQRVHVGGRDGGSRPRARAHPGGPRPRDRGRRRFGPR
jgi:transcriptional regulator GlxA family with amidase domain